MSGGDCRRRRARYRTHHGWRIGREHSTHPADGIAAEIGRDRWPTLPVFDWIAEEGAVPIDEMERTFNMGIGMVLIVEPAAAGNVKAVLAEQGEQVFEIGRTVALTGSTVIRMES